MIMKNNIKLFIIALSAILFINCDSDNGMPDVDTNSGWIEFAKSDYQFSAKACDGNAIIPVTLQTKTNDTELTVDYVITEVTGTLASVASNSLTGSVVIPAGSKRLGEINLNFLNDLSAFTTSVSFEVTLTATDRTNVTVGLSDDSKTLTTLVTLYPSIIPGTYSTISNGEAESTIVDGPLPDADEDLDDVTTVEDLAYSVTITDNGDGTFAVSDNTFGVYQELLAPWGVNFEIPGDITFDPLTGIISGVSGGLAGGVVTFTGTMNCTGNISGSWTGTTFGLPDGDSGNVVMTRD